MAELAYEVTFKGIASATLCAVFDGYDIRTDSGRTVVRCRQARLPDVLDRLEAHGLELLGVRLLAGPAGDEIV